MCQNVAHPYSLCARINPTALVPFSLASQIGLAIVVYAAERARGNDRAGLYGEKDIVGSIYRYIYTYIHTCGMIGDVYIYIVFGYI